MVPSLWLVTTADVKVSKGVAAYANSRGVRVFHSKVAEKYDTDTGKSTMFVMAPEELTAPVRAGQSQAVETDVKKQWAVPSTDWEGEPRGSDPPPPFP